MSSTAEMYRDLEWCTVVEKAGISLLEQERLKLEDKLSVHTLMVVMECSRINAHDLLLGYGLDQSEAKCILKA